jgi:hypothetical protein
LRGAGRKGRNFTNLFSSIAVCAYCEAKLKFRNRGPNGGVSLTCEAALRGLSCDATTWRYKDFETSFLTFVRELDLPSLVQDGQESRRRKALDESLAALEGKKRSLFDEQEKAYELFKCGGAAAKLVADKLETIALALQLPICFEVRALSGGLVSSTPE